MEPVEFTRDEAYEVVRALSQDIKTIERSKRNLERKAHKGYELASATHERLEHHRSLAAAARGKIEQAIENDVHVTAVMLAAMERKS